MNASRSILHVDMDAFYASVEQRDNPELRGKPLIVGGTSGRGVVAAASYEVRKFGVRSAMPIGRALALCPQAICVRPRMRRYAEVSAQVFAIFNDYTPLVEGLSLDEAYLDVTASLNLKGDPVSIAREIKQRIASETALTASVGVAGNKLVAKIASDLDKPDGLTVVSADRVHAVLDPLPVQRLPGLGRKKGDQVRAAGLLTIGDLRRADEQRLRPLFGNDWIRWRERASGIDERPVIADREEKSVSNERTFAADLAEHSAMHAELAALADQVAARLRAKSLRAACIGIKVRRHDFRTLTRQLTLTPATQDSATIGRAARQLLDEWLSHEPQARLRLLGVSASALDSEVQPDLFASTEAVPQRKLDATLDAIRDRFGAGSVARASVLNRRRQS
jgi:DNA polymerase-4